MTVEEFVKLLEQLVGSREPEPGQSALFIPNEVKEDLLSQPAVEAAVNQAIPLLTGASSPITAGDITSLAQMGLEPQLSDDRYPAPQDVSTPSFIGVSRNYSVDTGEGRVNITETDPNGDYLFYTLGSEISLLINQPPEVIAAVQAELVNAGMLKLGEFLPGKWGGFLVGGEYKDQEAFKNVLARANTTGNPDFTVALRYFVDNQEAIEDVGVEAPYLPPDYASVSAEVTNLFERKLGRKPKSYELDLLANQFMSDSKTISMANQPTTIDTGDITGEELMTGDLGNHIVEPPVQLESQIDPSARLFNKFQEITAKEDERLQAKSDIQTNNRNIINSITGLLRK